MAKKEAMERLPRPELPAPINPSTAGKINIIVSGPMEVKSSDPRVVVVRAS